MKVLFMKLCWVCLGIASFLSCTIDHHIPRVLPKVETREIQYTGADDNRQYTFNAHVVSRGTVPHQEVGVVIAPKRPGVVPDISHARIAIALSTVDDHSDNFATVPELVLAEAVQNGQTKEFSYRTYAIVEGGDVVYGDVFEGEISSNIWPGIDKIPFFVWNSDGTVTVTIEMNPVGTREIIEYGIVYNTSPLDNLDHSIPNNGNNPYVAFTAPAQPGTNTQTVSNPFQAVPADHKIHFDIYVKFSGSQIYGARGVQPSRP